MRFKSILIKGFRSFQDEFFNFENNGVYQIYGKNESGKTSLFEALFWCIYGEALKPGSKIENDIVPLKVQLYFERDGIAYEIIRTLNELIFLESGESKSLYKKDTQKRIIDVVGLTSMQFLNTVLMAQRGIRLADFNETDRRKFFESLFDLSWVDSLFIKVKAEQQRIEKELNQEEYKLDLHTKNLENSKIELQSILDRINTYENDQQTILESLLSTYDIVDSNYKELILLKPLEYIADDSQHLIMMHTLKDELDIINKTLDIKLLTVTHKERELQNLKKQIPKYPEDKCDKCGQSIVDPQIFKDILSKYNLELDELSKREADIRLDWPSIEEIDLLKNKRKEILEELNKINVEIKSLKDKETISKSKYKDWEDKKINMHNKVLAASAAIDQHNNSKKPDFESWLKDIKNKIKDCEELINQLQQNIEILEVEKVKCDYWVKALGVNGLKSHITKSYFHKLNKFFSYYGSIFGLYLNFNIDLSKKNTKTELEVSRKTGETIPYGNLSGGARARVELILQLALSKLIATNYSLIIFDESLIGLDREGIESVQDIFTIISKEMAVYFISHLDNNGLYNNVIEVIKTKNGSKIIR